MRLRSAAARSPTAKRRGRLRVVRRGRQDPPLYAGQAAIVVHGMNGVAPWSDGYAEAWFLPSANNLNGTDLFATSYAPAGRWHEYMKNQAGTAAPGWGPGQVTFRYPNTQRPATIWYHDHAIGMTRLKDRNM